MYRARSRSQGSAILRGSCSHGTRWRVNICLLVTGMLLLLVSVVRLQVGLPAVGDGVGFASAHQGENFSASGLALGVSEAKGVVVRGGRMLRIDRLRTRGHHGNRHSSDDVVGGTQGQGGVKEDGMRRTVSSDALKDRGDHGGGGVGNLGHESDDRKLSKSLHWAEDGISSRRGNGDVGNSRSIGEVGLDADGESEGRTAGSTGGGEDTGSGEEEEEEECSAEEEDSDNWKRRCNGRHNGEHLRRGSRLRSESDTAAFSSDDEPVNEETRSRIERIRNIEDVLLLNLGSALVKNETWGKIEDSKVQKKKGLKDFDPLNPENNPLLQDPDSADSGALTKNDKLVLKALRFMGKEPPPAPVANRDTDRVIHNPLEDLDGGVRSRVIEGRRKESLQNDADGSKRRQGEGDSREEGHAWTRESGKVPQTGEAKGHPTEKMVHKLDLRNNIRWADFPGLHPQLSFSGFIDEFAFDRNCSIRVFMAWMSPGWAFTVRHQRVLESLLYIHPKACVVVFSETVELSFFKSFVEEGYRVAVMQPNLQVLLENTASIDFARIWAEWRQVELFNIHYTELLRLAALYKYGGIYLDWDMIVLRPLDGLMNTIGTELLEDGHQRPNGAIMMFDSGSPFLNITMDEFTATYDEKRKEWNGAELLTRVLNAPADDKYIYLADKDRPHLEPPISFFPMTSSRIVSYFKTPRDEYESAESLKLLDKILSRSYTVHLWNDLTRRLVPEPGSLVAHLMDKNCLRCDDIL